MSDLLISDTLCTQISVHSVTFLHFCDVHILFPLQTQYYYI